MGQFMETGIDTHDTVSLPPTTKQSWQCLSSEDYHSKSRVENKKGKAELTLPFRTSLCLFRQFKRSHYSAAGLSRAWRNGLAAGESFA